MTRQPQQYQWLTSRTHPRTVEDGSKVKKLSKPARSKAAAKPVGKAKPKREQVKKAARAIAWAAEAVAVEVIEQPAPGVLAVTEVEETEARQAS
jgi:hypothetical protein